MVGEKVNEILRRFTPPEDPVFIDDLGCWYVGGGFYRLRQRKDGLRAITCSRHRDQNSAQFLVRTWKPGQAITNDESDAAILQHASSYKELVITRAILKKARYRDVARGRDVYSGPHQHYVSVFHDHYVSRIAKSLFSDDNALAKIIFNTMWPNSHQGNPHQEEMSRKDAELLVCKDFVASLERALTSRLQIDPDLRNQNLAHFYFGRGARILNREKGKFLPGLEKIDAVDGFQENFITVIEMVVDSPLRHPIRFAWKLIASMIEGHSLVTREESKKWPGCLNPKDELVKELSYTSKYAYPLGGFLRPLREGAFARNDFIGQPVFGKQSLLKRIHRIPSFAQDGMDGLSEAYLGLTKASTARFYWNQNRTGDPLQDCGAIKAFRPDGSTITTFNGQARVWISHEPERMFDSSDSVIPDVLMERLERGQIVEIIQCPKGPVIRELTFAQADDIFRRKFSGAFRSPHQGFTEVSATPSLT